MSCPDQKSKLTDWILGELSVTEAEDLQRHVDHCAGCAQELAGLRGIHQTLKQQLTDRELPAHLVFLPERAPASRSGFLASLWRTAALAAVSAVVFLAIVLVGYTRWGRQPSAVPAAERAGLTQAQVEVLVAQAAQAQWARQQRQFEAANEKFLTDVRQDQARALAQFNNQMQYLQSAQNIVWKQTQEQNALVELIARNSLGQGTGRENRP